uniref:Transposase MuDR plant domain-containing protein n=1 Tax=Ananas comosus var. bracteatus TaxID=296719 RepID=A0A6V7P902_ANACO|nr:unnamed protein product [Ananas comosus var. bracteatus]
MSSSDEDGPSWPKYPVYNKRDLERTELKLGMKFASASKFRTVLRNHAISNGYDFNFEKNYGDRVDVKYKKDTTAQKRCEWRVHASWNAYEECFQIKSLQPKHKCAKAHGWTFISDRQNGLVEVFDALLPRVDHRFCVSYFSPDIKCDLLCNNMCEAWNWAILDARELPIIDLMKKIRRQIMTRFQEKRQYMERQSGILCPKVQAKLEKIKEKARHCEPLWAGETIFEVHCNGKQYTVNLPTTSCECTQ